MNVIAEQIYELVTIPDVLKMYGYGLGRNRRIPCPLHDGKDANFAYTDTVYHCWTCGVKGNVIGLVMQLFRISFGQAITRINYDFNLRLAVKKPSYRQRIQRQGKVAQKATQRAEKQRLDREYIAAVDEYRELLKVKQKHFPKHMEDIPNAAFIYAAVYLPKLEDWLDQNLDRTEVRG